MMRSTTCAPRVLRNGVIGGLLLVSVLATPNCLAQSTSLWKVEEDWEMVTQEPDSAIVSPQVSFAMFPCGHEHIDEVVQHAHNVYFLLQMNYFADDYFSAGGFHVAAVEQEDIVDEERSATQIVLSSDHDHVSWTSVMAVVDNKLMFAVKNGYGNDWGTFGGPEYLVQMQNCPISNLKEYDYSTSLKNVDISFGANRVDSITLKEVRLYYTDGNVVTIPVNLHP